ncbi:P-loop ATPase, Sll1717 family [Pseudomonas sp. NFACC36]|uniref:P-loop ATPase, Sll1717 family n=1 Tax=Pseudomonas sp. NFACC36 TaxID=1566197 RepID=UPI00091CCAF4|nr:hypothetical protein [Pseudomonas sp. NFACC36]SFY22664.1 hypothetical protein SAMN03159309_04686 [Pseudomonas sp. NFACC36]
MSLEWKDIDSLKEPKNDAYNYKGRSSKEFFSKIFLRTSNLEKCLDPSVYYIIGEKGAGKTAYAVYLENNPDEHNVGKLTSMTETQYKRFIELKRQNKLNYSDYANIWRSMLLFVISQMIIEKSKKKFHIISGKFRKLEGEISKWSKNALSPEIESAFEAIKELGFNLEGKAQNFKSAVNGKQAQTEKESVLKHHLLTLEQNFKEAISDLSLNKSHTLYIDGIDYKPENINHKEYIECIKGLGEAVWQLNADFFSEIRDSKGRIKICLLVRPDVLNALNLYNSNSRIQDNSVLLDWSTTEEESKSSQLYELCDKFLSSQQYSKRVLGTSWEHYFHTPSEPNKVFKYLTRNTFQKPRDFLTFIKIAIAIEQDRGKGQNNVFSSDIINSPQFNNKFSDYLLGEVKNYTAFYMSQEDFVKYIKFFQFLDGKHRFTAEQFSAAFKAFKTWADGEDFNSARYLKDEETLLQLFYDVNIIGYMETTENNTQFFHWAYRERTLNNIAPKVKFGAELRLNPGISKALDVGSKFIPINQQSVRAPSQKKAQRRNYRNRRNKQKAPAPE